MDTTKRDVKLRDRNLDEPFENMFAEMERFKTNGLYNDVTEAATDPEVPLRSLNFEQALRRFAILIGAVPFLVGTLVILISELSSSHGSFPPDWPIPLFFFALICTATAATGYGLSRPLAENTKKISTLSLPIQLLLTPLAGLVWGALSGLAGGAFIFVIGAIPGAIIGGLFGMVAFTYIRLVFAVLSENDFLKKSLFYPTTIGFLVTVIALLFNG